MTEQFVPESTDLLQALIRNACVNDGREESGHEDRSVDTLRQYLGSAGFDVETYAARPGRESLVVRIEGTDPTVPSLLLMGHTDVVPVNPDGWSRDPFGGDLVDGFVWGRGAVDMLNITASQAVAMKHLSDSGFRPRGTLIYLAVADEEARGTWGAQWLLANERDAVYADNVITESGGFQVPTSNGPRLPVLVEEKGAFWARITTTGVPGHASQPYKTDNALITAAEVVRRIAAYNPPAKVSSTWRAFLEGLEYPPDAVEGLTDPERIDAMLDHLDLGMARVAHACTHTTFAPTVAHGGTKTNVIPDHVEIDVDVRALPDQTLPDVHAMFREALGDLADQVTLEVVDDPGSRSPMGTPLWDSLSRVSGRLCEGSALVPMTMIAATDNRYFRRAGSVGYGFALFSQRLRFEDYATMFHGNDERVDQESLGLSTALWIDVARDLVG